jgi:hypothetical protein
MERLRTPARFRHCAQGATFADQEPRAALQFDNRHCGTGYTGNKPCAKTKNLRQGIAGGFGGLALSGFVSTRPNEPVRYTGLRR